MPTVSAVVIAMIGNALINGVLIASTFARVSLPDGSPEPVSTITGTVPARINGGCTIGPNRLRLRTAAIAATEPTR